jgi:L-lactate dehydrogenase (cytochrome)
MSMPRTENHYGAIAPYKAKYTARKRISDCHSIADLRDLAHHRLPRPIFHYLEGAADDEFTAHRNTAAFDAIRIAPRSLQDVASLKTETRLLGQTLAWPVFCGATGASRFCHPDGELAVAKACAHTGTLYCLSTMSTFALEDVAAALPGPKMFQLYIFKDRGITRELIERCRQSSYGALCLTVDTAVVGKRERDLRTGWGVPIKLSARMGLSFARTPRWLIGQARRGRISLPTIATLSGSNSLVAQTRYVGNQLDASVTWKDVSDFVEQWRGPFAIKGLMAVNDAMRAREVGASAVILSNHGGRQLDGAASPLDVLPQIARAVGDTLDVIVDGGVRRGSHVLKALALGAKACSIGRPYLYGLSAGGQAGVTKALDILKTEFVRAMQLSGVRNIQDIGPEILRGMPQ